MRGHGVFACSLPFVAEGMGLTEELLHVINLEVASLRGFDHSQMEAEFIHTTAVT